MSVFLRFHFNTWIIFLTCQAHSSCQPIFCRGFIIRLFPKRSAIRLAGFHRKLCRRFKIDLATSNDVRKIYHSVQPILDQPLNHNWLKPILIDRFLEAKVKTKMKSASYFSCPLTCNYCIFAQPISFTKNSTTKESYIF